MRWPAEASVRALALGLAAAAIGCSGESGPSAAAEPLLATSAVVMLDGSVEEWPSALPLIDDPLDAEGAGIDVRTIHALDDPAWLYLAFDVEREVNAQRMPGTIHFLIDADADVATGRTMFGMSGVDLVVDVSRVEDPVDDPRGLGVAVRAVADGGPGPTSGPYPLDVVIAPTWSASTFEMRMSRLGAMDEGLPAMAGRIRLKAVYVEAGTVRDESAEAEYRMSTPRAAEVRREAPAETLERPAATTRVAQLNVSSTSFTRRSDGFARLLAAVDPDVLLLDELPGDVVEQDLADFFASPPLAAREPWSFVLGRSGGRQRAAVAARGLEVRPAGRLEDVRHRPGALDGLRGVWPESFHELLDYEASAGVPAAGAWVALPGGEVLFTALDLTSRGYVDSPEDQLRALQATAIRNAVAAEIRAAAEGREAPAVIVGGDLNLVGSRTPMRLLSTRLYADETRLEPVEAVRLGERTLSTWRDADQPFLPGRLDFLLVPPTRLDVANAFVFATEDLSDDLLAVLGLERDLSERLSDHLVVVADVRVR
jgi:hypothetical protein